MFEKENPSSGPLLSSPRSISDPSVRKVLSEASSQPDRLHASPYAWEDQQLYFLLPDRFSTNSEDGAMGASGTAVHGTIPHFAPTDISNAINPPNDAAVWRENGTIWQGGTLKGIQSKIGYLKRLGVTALWVGPIFKQVPNDEHLYHGYAVQDFLEIDPHFGTREHLRDLVASAHSQEIYVILDIILNHSGDVFAYVGGPKTYQGGQKYEVSGFRDSNGSPSLPFQSINPNDPPKNATDCAIWPAELQAPGTFTCEGSITSWDASPEFLDGDFLTLKDIALGPASPEGFTPSAALKTLCEVYKYWITYADLDGYRIDTVKHMGNGPTRHLCTVLHEFASSVGKENFFLVGEVTGQYAFETVETTGLDAALGIGNVQEKLWNVPKGSAQPTEYFDLFRNATYLKKGSNAWMKDKVVTMIDDHDQVWKGEQKGRFCSDDVGPKVVLAAVALNLTTLGIPCIYYGTEQAFDGAGGSDRYIREAMFGGTFGAFRSQGHHFFDESTSLFTEISKLCALRKKIPALRRGRQYLRQISNNGEDFWYPTKIGEGRIKSLVAWSRIFGETEVLCAINTDTERRTGAWITVDATLHDIGGSMSAVYRSPDAGGMGGGKGGPKAVVEERNGRAVWVEVGRGGFVMFM